VLLTEVTIYDIFDQIPATLTGVSPLRDLNSVAVGAQMAHGALHGAATLVNLAADFADALHTTDNDGRNAV